jgi:dGTPase
MVSRQELEEIEDRRLERTICDYIAGMTDRYAIEEHKRLYDLDLQT